MKKIGKMSELAWVLGMILSNLGVVLCIKSSLGMSMFTATPYSLYIYVKNNLWGGITQGMCEYLWQAVLLIIMCIVVRKFKWKYLLSFGTAVFAGITIDIWKLVLNGDVIYGTMYERILAFVGGTLLISLGIAMTFRTYIPVQIYELMVKEISVKFNKDINRVKLIYDFITLATALAVTAFCMRERFFEVIGVGTVIIVFVNSLIIKYSGKLLDTFFTFEPAFPGLEKIINK